MSTCEECVFAGPIPGNAHTKCNHPLGLELFMANKKPVINEHGAKNGWANWPFDFDPIWIEACEFKQMEDRNNNDTPR